MKLLKHVRVPQSRLDKGDWSMHCSCGWKGSTGCTSGGRVKTGTEVEQELERQFKEHLPESERITYVLVDQRIVEVPVFTDGKPMTGNPEIDNERPCKLATTGVGNFLMPWGTPCQLLHHYRADGEHWVSYLSETGETGDLPVGEVRTADGRVFKLDR